MRVILQKIEGIKRKVQTKLTSKKNFWEVAISSGALYDPFLFTLLKYINELLVQAFSYNLDKIIKIYHQSIYLSILSLLISQF